MAPDFYDLLGVTPEASDEDIKRAYRRLARRLHPDINPGDQAAARRFRAIVEAYETLSDPDRRREYNRSGGQVRTTVVESVSFGFEGFDFSATSTATHTSSTFGDLFADVIASSVGGGTGPEDGADIHAEITVGFADMMGGATLGLTVLRRDACRSCRGAGIVPVAESVCPGCQGTGAVRSMRGRMVFAKACARCGGSGRLRHVPCQGCAGAGVATRAEGVAVAIPPGVRDGERLRVVGRGHAGRRGGRSGDLHVTVHVTPHPFFRREGDDLFLDVPVGVHEAALGARFEIPTPDGPARLRVPPGTPAGQRFRLRGRGVPAFREGERGDLVAVITLVLPPVLDERSKELLREFGDLHGEGARRGRWDETETA
jgi:molecular chaperone DnaJ